MLLIDLLMFQKAYYFRHFISDKFLTELHSNAKHHLFGGRGETQGDWRKNAKDYPFHLFHEAEIFSDMN